MASHMISTNVPRIQWDPGVRILNDSSKIGIGGFLCQILCDLSHLLPCFIDWWKRLLEVWDEDSFERRPLCFSQGSVFLMLIHC